MRSLSAAILSTAMVMAPLVHGQSGAPIHTCSQYNDCVTTTVTEVAPQCGDTECSFKVCYTLSSGGACDKGSSETFSLACDNGVGEDPLEQCNQDSIFDTWDTIGEGISGFSACQYVEAGGYAYFASKDYPECSDSFVETLSIDGISGNSSVNYSCGPSDHLGVAGHVCTSWGTRECLFTVGPMPECEIEDSSTMVPSDASSFALTEIVSTEASDMLISDTVSSDITDSPSTVPSMIVFTSTDVPTVSPMEEEETVLLSILPIPTLLPSFLPLPTTLPTVETTDTSDPSTSTTIPPSTDLSLVPTMDSSEHLTDDVSQLPTIRHSSESKRLSTEGPTIESSNPGSFSDSPSSVSSMIVSSDFTSTDVPALSPTQEDATVLASFLPLPTLLPSFLPLPTLLPTIKNTATSDPSTETTMTLEPTMDASDPPTEASLLPTIQRLRGQSTEAPSMVDTKAASYSDGPSMIVSNDVTLTEVQTVPETEEELTFLPTFLKGPTVLPTVAGTSVLASSEKTVPPTTVSSSQVSTDASLVPTLQSSFGDSTEQPTELKQETPTVKDETALSPTPMKDASSRDQPAPTSLPTVISVDDSGIITAILSTSDAMMHHDALVYSTSYLSLMVVVILVILV